MQFKQCLLSACPCFQRFVYYVIYFNTQILRFDGTSGELTPVGNYVGDQYFTY